MINLLSQQNQELMNMIAESQRSVMQEMEN
jgi:hypothetical protein